jgi:hypothetical protein
VTRWWRAGDAWEADEASRFPYAPDRSGVLIEGPGESERWSFVAMATTALHVSTSTFATGVLFDCDGGAWPIAVRMVTHGCSGF